MIDVAQEAPPDVAGYDPFRDAGDCWYDGEAAWRAVDFFPRFVRHIKGSQFAGKTCTLEWWQTAFIATLFGWKRKDGSRRYRTCYCEIPRKNGKSFIASGVGLYLLTCDSEPGAEIYSAACDREQASIVFDVAAAMVRKSKPLKKRLRVLDSIKKMRYFETNSFYKAIAADAAGSHGFNPHGVLFDELHTQKNRGLWGVLTSGMGARRQPLNFVITTAGTDRLSICWEQHQYAKRVRDGFCDPSFLPVLYGAEDDDDWQDEEVWRKANPNLGVSVSIDFLRDEHRKAVESPAKENEFRNLYLNQWTQQVTRYIPMRLWDAEECRQWFEPKSGRECYGGLDLSSTQDLTAWVLVFPKGKGFVVKPHFWIAAAAAEREERLHNTPYRKWKEQGLVEVVPGDTIDYRLVRKQIVRDVNRYDMVQLAYDPRSAEQLALQLADEEGINVVKFVQARSTYNEPTRYLLKLLHDKRIYHGGHELLRWNADCVEVTDMSQPIMPVKPQFDTAAKIDGIAALIMAIGVATTKRAAKAGGICDL